MDPTAHDNFGEVAQRGWFGRDLSNLRLIFFAFFATRPGRCRRLITAATKAKNS